MGIFERNQKPEIEEKLKQTEEDNKSELEDYSQDDALLNEREARLSRVMQNSNRWNTSGLKPNTKRKKIGLACLVIGLVGYLILQYVVKG